MLNKKRINKKLRNYIKSYSRKGYSKHSITEVLVEHGYDESYVDGLIKKHHEVEFVKKYSLIGSLTFIFLLISLNFIYQNKEGATAYVAKDTDEKVCCIQECLEKSKNECNGDFENKKCSEVEECSARQFEKQI